MRLGMSLGLLRCVLWRKRDGFGGQLMLFLDDRSGDDGALNCLRNVHGSGGAEPS